MLLDEALRALVREELRKVLRDELERCMGSVGARTPANDEFLSYQEAAEVAHVSKGTVANWIKQDLLRPCGPGRSKRVRRSDVERVMAGSQRKKDAVPAVADQVAMILGRKKAA